jgi:hypothetical protein
MAESMLSTSIAGVLLFLILMGTGVLVILWIALPFSIFGIKDILKELIAEQKKTNDILSSMTRGRSKAANAAPKAANAAPATTSAVPDAPLEDKVFKQD